MNADLQIEETGGGTRQLHEDDLNAVTQGAATETTLLDVLAALGASVTVDGTVSLSPATLAALEAVTVSLSGAVALDAPTIAALETITVANPTTNPETGLSKEATQTTVLARLTSILAAVDGLEGLLGNVDLDGDAISAAIVDLIAEVSDDLTPGDITGLATSTNQLTEIARQEAVRDRLPSALVSGRLSVDGSGVTQPVTLPALPTVAASQVSVDTSQRAVPATNLADRKTVSVKALADNGANVYVGLTGVSSTQGFELAPGDSVDIDADDAVNLFAIAASGTQRVSTAEIA